MVKSNFPLLSVIIPVYNAEKYLAETLESVIAQDIGFQDNIEIVLINDGSTDKSEEVCLAFKSKYPENIRYIKQKNAGVSAARNKGIDVARGKYISFLDSDDKYSPDVASKVCKFFDEHYDEIDVVAIKLVFFDAKTGDHMLNYKFTKTRVIDIEKEPECVQLSGGSSFIKAESVKGRHRFDTQLKLAEDAKFLSELIIEKGAFGVVSEPSLQYRRLKSTSSALAGSLLNRSYYLKTPKHFSEHLLGLTASSKMKPSKYIQHVVMYDLQWRLNQHSQDVLSPREEKNYKQTIYDLLRQIDDDVIMAQRWMPLERKIFVLKKKYEDYEKRIHIEQGKVYINETLIWNYTRSPQKLNIDFISVQPNGTIKLEGYFAKPATRKLEVQILMNDKNIKIQKVVRKYMRPHTFLGDVIETGTGFVATIVATQKSYLRGVLVGEDGMSVVMPLDLRFHTKIGNFQRSYRIAGRNILTNMSKDCLKVSKYSLRKHIYSEGVFCLMILLHELLGKKGPWHPMLVTKDLSAEREKKPLKIHKRFITVLGRRATYYLSAAIKQLRKKGVPNYVKDIMKSIFIINVRLWVVTARRFRRKELWIVSDRPTAAGDNGEALFEFIQKQDNKNIKAYFAISKKSPDYNRIKKIGPVLNWGSYRYRLQFLLVDKVISSHLDGFITNPYGDSVDKFMNLLRFKFVFLNHGINKDDMSSWMNRFDKNISLFIAAGVPEYDSVVNGNYYYPKENISLSGFPRYDKLHDDRKDKVIIAPTWRKYVANKHDDITGERVYDESFKTTEYFYFYQKLLNDDRLMKSLEKHRLKIEFYLHPAHRTQLKDFKGNDFVDIMQYPYDYSSAFREGSVLLTDYSSVAFDFAYMKKPVIFAQFDEEEFYGKHWVRGYFSYDKDGMGPVARDYESTVKELIRILENDCNMEEKYKKRVEKFFAYTDKNNSQRVYKAILEMPK